MPDKIKKFYSSSLKHELFVKILAFSILTVVVTVTVTFLATKWMFPTIPAVSLFLSIALVLSYIAYLVSKYFANRILRPLNEPDRIIDDIGDDESSERIECKSPGEAGHLATSLNTVAERIRLYHGEMAQKMKNQEKHLLNVLNESTDGIISLDINDRITTWNRGAEIIYGYKADEIIGKHLETLFPEELKKSGEYQKMSKILSEKGHLRHYETERVRKDGRRILVDITRNLLKDGQGNPIGFSAIVKDITEKKEFEKRIMQTEKLTTMGQISANIAHELRNPLMGISGAVQVLMKKLEGNPPLWETLKKIFEQVQRLDSTLKGLLSFARPQSPYFVKTNVNEIIDQILFFITPDAQSKRITIVKNLSKSIPEVSLDPDQIKQVLLNIVLNAIQAMPDGGELSIETDNSNGNGSTDELKVRIGDTGVGISEEIRDRIFKPFFTTKIKGTGLGLVISKNIIKEHGGKIDFRSEPDKGSVFEITLPIRQ